MATPRNRSPPDGHDCTDTIVAVVIGRNSSAECKLRRQRSTNAKQDVMIVRQAELSEHSSGPPFPVLQTLGLGHYSWHLLPYHLTALSWSWMTLAVVLTERKHVTKRQIPHQALLANGSFVAVSQGDKESPFIGVFPSKLSNLQPNSALWYRLARMG